MKRLQNWLARGGLILLMAGLLGCEAVEARADTDPGTDTDTGTAAHPVQTPTPRPVRPVAAQAYAYYGKGVLLDTRSKRLRHEAERAVLLDRELQDEKRRQAARLWVRAREALEQAAALDPEGVTPARYLGFSLAARGEFQDAIPYLERNVKLDPDDYRARVQLALVYEQEDRIEGALEQLRAALPALQGGEARWLLPEVEGRLMSLTEQLYGLAAATVPLVDALDRNAKERWVNREADRIISQGAQEEGFAERVQEAIPEEKRGLGFHYLLGRVAFLRREWESADRHLAQALEVEADFWPACFHRSLALAELGRVEEAVGLLEEARGRGLEPALAQMLIGSLQSRAGNYEQARVALEESVRQAPLNPVARCELAGLYEKMGLVDDAIEQLKVNLTHHPDHADSLNALGYFYAEKNTELEEAERLIRRALVQEGDNGAYLDSLGWVFFKQGKLGEALEALSRAAEKLTDPVVFGHLGDVQRERGELEEAGRWWKRALELDPTADDIRRKLNALGDVGEGDLD